MVNKIKELISQLNTYRDAYYNQNQSIISDKEYDALYDELSALEQETGIVFANSPTQSVGYEAVSKLEKVVHNHPLLSLNKTTEADEFAAYFGARPYIVMAKMDGLTCSLLYRDGVLVRAESRGNGEVGEDITHNAKVFVNLPANIPYKGEIIVDGECIISREDFERINRPLIKKATDEAHALGLEGAEFTEYIRKHSYANPRNLASGSVRQLDSKIAKERNVRFIAWKLHDAKDNYNSSLKETDLYTSSFAFLQSLGFEIVPFVSVEYRPLAASLTSANWAIDTVRTLADGKGYPIDGIVGTFNDVKYGMSLGSTGHHPRHSLAFKFYQEENETTLKDIEWSTSRTGLVNPVAIFEPVEIDGTTVSRATLNNVSIIKELELDIGDTVSIIKANAIIPKITDNLTRSNTYQIPTVCPECGEPLTIRNDNGREMLYCTNKHCPAIVHDKISNFATREAMNIVGISEERLRVLMQLKYISEFADIYTLRLHRDEITKIRGFGKSSVDLLLEAIDASRNCKLQNVIVAIGIPGVGKSAARTIAEYCADVANGNVFETFLNLAEANHNWSELPEIGEVTSKSINQYLIDNMDEIRPLVQHLNVTQPKLTSSTELDGKTFCITGKLVQFASRSLLVADIERKGGSVVSSVTAKTMYLITNDKDSGSSKNKAAEKYGTKIITEAEYLSSKF